MKFQFFTVTILSLSLLTYVSLRKTEAADTNPILDSSYKFNEFVDAASNKSDSDLERMFREIVLPSNADYYTYRLESLKALDGGVSGQLKQQIKDFVRVKLHYSEISQNLVTRLPEAIEKFQKHFPDFSPSYKINIVHSLGELNGGTREVNGQTQFYLGIDVIAKFHNWPNQIPFFQHELFHLYHMQMNPNVFAEGSVGISLWKEGLATFVSKLLEPDATPAEMMLEIPPNLHQECISKKQSLAKLIKRDLRATDAETYKLYFLMSGGNEVVPKRAGYCIGYLAIFEAAKTMSLTQMISANQEIVYKTLEDALLKISSD